MRLTVGVLTYRSAANLPPLLAALPAGLAGVDDWRLVVVDSGSFDDTLTVAKDLAPDATLVQLDSNRGFAAAANAVAAAHPDADAVLLLSPTTRLRPGCAAELLAALAEPGVGIAVPRLIGRDGAYKTSLRRRPTLGRALAEAVLGGNRASRLGRGELIADPAGYDGRTPADWATGAVTMFSRACLTATGPWDETFFLYSEETEFALRAPTAASGWPSCPRRGRAQRRRRPQRAGPLGHHGRQPGPAARDAARPRRRHRVLGGDHPGRGDPLAR